MTELKNNDRKVKIREERIVIDCAGAVKGGAARFLRELQSYLAETHPPNVELIGLGKQLTSQWLLQREIIAASATRRISLNNVGFLNPRGENITLLRNILQFATESDLEKLDFSPSRRLRAQTPIVRALARASEILVVPSTRMADQVEAVIPTLKEKLAVRFHPVTKPAWAGAKPARPRDILLPIVPSPYKNLDQHIPEFLAAAHVFTDEPVRLIVPTTPETLPSIGNHPAIEFIGSQTAHEMQKWWRDCGAVYFPVEFESFGYALAESRAYGRSIIAQNTPQNNEIAGPAIQPYTRHDQESLTSAISMALNVSPVPDPGPFDPANYFHWLFSGARV